MQLQPFLTPRKDQVLKVGKFDYLSSLYSSRILAKQIEDFWHKKGRKHIRVWVEKEDFGPTEIYVVRSNITLTCV